MIRLLILLLFGFLESIAQHSFVKEFNPGKGNTTRILSTSDSGWVIITMDSLILTKIDKCGNTEWAFQYNAHSDIQHLSDFITTSNGDFVLLSRMNKNNVYHTAITRIDNSGNILWSYSYGDGDYNHFPYTAAEDSRGNLIIYGIISHISSTPFYNSLTKLTSAGNLIWTKLYNHGWIWGRMIVTSDDGFLARTGSIFIKTDSSGTVEWTSSITSPTYFYPAAVEVTDGYIFAGYDNDDNKTGLYKIDKQGNLAFPYRKEAAFAGNPPILHKKSNGNIAGMFNKTVGSTNYPTLVEFDHNINIINESSLSIPGISLTGNDVCYASDNAAVVCGTTQNGSVYFSRQQSQSNLDCVVSLPATIFTQETVSQSFLQTSTLNYTYGQTPENITFTNVANNSSLICNQEKILWLGNDTSGCNLSSIVLENQSADVFDFYEWSTGATTQSITVVNLGLYVLTVTDLCSTVPVTDSINIDVLPAISFSIEGNRALCPDSMNYFYAPPCDSCTYLWNTGSNEDSIEIQSEGIYSLTVTNYNGCITSDTAIASFIKCSCELYIPSAFTPDADGINDLFYCHYYCDLLNFELYIYNRWGQAVFTTRDPEFRWDGHYKNRKVPEGVYYFSLNYADKNTPGSSTPVRGSVTVLY